MKHPEKVAGSQVSVIGAARSGLGVTSLLASRGAKVFVSDHLDAKTLSASVRQLQAWGIPFETGSHSQRVFDCALMVISPGVPSSAAIVQDAHRRGVRVVSELEAASWFCPAPIIAVTGSNGKTTTTTLIGRMLGDARRAHVVAGNIGTAFSATIDTLTKEHLVVLEVSSFQLDHIESFRPWVSVILNITEDHMDRYNHSMERYAASKARVFMNQREDDVVIYSVDDPWTKRIVGEKATCRTVGFSVTDVIAEGGFLEAGQMTTVVGGHRSRLLRPEEMTLKGMHNVSNALAAALAADVVGIRAASIRSTLRNFKGVEHRLEFVRELEGVRYINDSKATNVDSVWYALQAFSQPIVLLLGGRDKGNDYRRLVDLVKHSVRHLIAIGESAGKVEEAFRGSTDITMAGSMEEAVRLAHSIARHGDVVLLSPACASFDWFENYEHRGRVFKAAVHHLGASSAPEGS
jgi:UDP-N-acetylmuramoylalanine--D-glutamate ligase